MGKPTATLEDIGVTMGVQNELPETNVEPQLPRRAGPMRFAYPSGSRPLEGFTIKRGIGIGGFGEVYFATSDAGKEVALKHIQRHLDIELRGVTQCLNLKHVHLLALYDIKYDSAGEAWVVMEYVSGETLKDIVERHPEGMPLDVMMHWFEGMGAGVKYLHDHGIVHRDLKPGNIFADGDIVKIGDYGLSKFISCSRRSGQTESVGTFHYMAPEIGRGVYGKEIDIYALGIMLHEMLTGQVPFDGETSQEIIMRHLTADPDLSRVPAPFAPLIRKSLAKDPQHRYSTVAEMLEALHEAAAKQRGKPRVGFAKFAKKEGPAGSPPGREKPIYIDEEGVVDDGIFLGPLRENPVPRGEASPGPAARAAENSAARSSEGSLPEEPIARAVVQGVRRVMHGFRGILHDSNPPTKVFLLVLLVFGIFAYGGFLFPLGFAALVLYLVYFGVRSLVLVASGQAPPLRRISRREQAVLAARDACRRMSPSQRLAELMGSMLMAAILCSAISFISFHRLGVQSVEFWASCLWLALTGTIGTWLLLVLGKAWELSAPEPRQRKLLLLGAGLLLGLFASGLAEYLQVDWRILGSAPRGPQAMQPTSWYSPDGLPQLFAFLAYFGGLLLVPGWWRQVDPLRTARFRFVSLVAVVGWAWILHLILYFPQPAGMVLAAMMAVATQMSSPHWDLRNLERKFGEPIRGGLR
jgi:hypothetical protein